MELNWDYVDIITLWHVCIVISGIILLTDFVSNDEVRSRTGQPFLSDTIRGCHLSFFGHLSHADPSQNHSRALQSCILGPPRDWRCRVGRPRQSWLRTVKDDLWPLNFGLATARRHALDRSAWRLLVETAMSTWHAPERENTVNMMMCLVLQSLAQLLCEMRDVNKSLQFEVDDLKQKLKDSNGDIKVCISNSFVWFCSHWSKNVAFSLTLLTFL